jgi:transposase InsO family protein
VTKELRRHGYCVNHKRAVRLMAENDIVGVTPRRFVRTTLPAKLAPELPDLVRGDFGPGEPNRRYCGDITYVPTGEGWLYLASVIDLGSRRLAGWAMDDNMRTGLVSSALRRALELRGASPGRCSTPTGAVNTSLASTGRSARAWVSASQPEGWRPVSTTWLRSRSGRRSKENWSTATASRPVPKPKGRHCLDKSLQLDQAPLHHRVPSPGRVGD